MRWNPRGELAQSPWKCQREVWAWVVCDPGSSVLGTGSLVPAHFCQGQQANRINQDSAKWHPALPAEWVSEDFQIESAFNLVLRWENKTYEHATLQQQAGNYFKRVWWFLWLYCFTRANYELGEFWRFVKTWSNSGRVPKLCEPWGLKLSKHNTIICLRLPVDWLLILFIKEVTESGASAIPSTKILLQRSHLGRLVHGAF